MQVWLNIESYVFFNLLSKFEEKSHNIANPYNFSYFFRHSTLHCKSFCKIRYILNHNSSLQIKKICSDIWFNIFAKILWFFSVVIMITHGTSTLNIRKNYTADIMTWLTAPRWQMIWGCFRSFVLHRIRILPDLMMDYRCIAISRNCSLFRTTRVHFRFIGSSCCSCAFVIFCVISVGCCWFVSVLPWSSAIVCW